MLNPTELINPRCQQTGTTPVLKTTHHLFLDLPKLTEELQAYIDETSDLGGWSSNCLSVSPCCTSITPHSTSCKVRLTCLKFFLHELADSAMVCP
jgi:hypothetical protein